MSVLGDEVDVMLEITNRTVPENTSLPAPTTTKDIAGVGAKLIKGINLKVTMAQITTDPGCFEANTKKIIDQIGIARDAGSNLIVFPELVLPGYAHLDLVKNPDFVQLNLDHLQQICKQCHGITALVGFIEPDSDKIGPDGTQILYNSVAVIQNGEVVEVIRKQLLPTYDIFDEKRYYTPGGTSKLVEIDGVKVGVGVCEDLWDKGYETKVYQGLIDQGAELLVNLSASPFEPGKVQKRAELIEHLLQDREIPFLYNNLVGAFDSYHGEIPFDGQSIARGSNGKYYQTGQFGKEESYQVDLSKPASLVLEPAQEIHEVFDALVLGTREYFRRSGMKHAYIPVSGGIDSAVGLIIATEALGAENVTAVTMPSHVTSDETLDDAITLANNLGVKIDVRPIAQLYQDWLTGFREANGHEPENLTKQNVQARFRGIIIMEYTNEDRTGLVISCGNKTETALGYCTMYGDMCGGLAVISDLNKLRVYEVAKFYNLLKRKEIVPETTIVRLPSAELEVGQTDVQNLPADYDVLSPLVDDIIDRQLTRGELHQKYQPEVVDGTLRLIKINEFKRRQAAPGIRVTPKAFGFGRRIPISHGMY